jgi:transcriptional regulator with XRE-family HTH domain
VDNRLTPECHHACHPGRICETRREGNLKGDQRMTDDRPAWARRMTREREARNWSQAEAVRAMRMHAPGNDQLPDDASMLRQWKRWESGEHMPSDYYQPIIAATFGTVTHAVFPVPPRCDADSDVLAVSGMDTLELVGRLQHSDLDEATLTGLRVTADRLYSLKAHRGR